MKLRDSAIRAIKPTSKRETYRFDGYPSLGLRVTPRGVKTWGLHYRVKGTGKQRWLTIGTFDQIGEADVRERYNDLRKRVARGEDPAAPPPPEPEVLTVRGLVELYFDVKANSEMPLRASTASEARRLLMKDLVNAPRENGGLYGDLPASHLTREMVRSILDGIVERGAPIVANRLLAWIKKVYNVGTEENAVASSPVAGMRRRSRERARVRHLTFAEFAKLWSAVWNDTSISASIKRAMLFLMLVPARRDEILKLRAGDIGDDGFVTLSEDDTKQGRLQRYFIIAPARDLVSDVTEGWLFPSPRNQGRPIVGRSITQALRRHLKEWGLEQMTIHDLRRTLATILARQEVHPDNIGRILGHNVDGDVTREVYIQFTYDPQKIEAGVLLEALVSDILARGAEARPATA